MGTSLRFHNFKNLYEYWDDSINSILNDQVNSSSSQSLVNLASAEYSKAAILNKIDGNVITPVFKELRGDEYKLIPVYAKKARGLMTRFIIENKIENPEDLKHFDMEGYAYTENLSSEHEWMFTR